MTFWTSTLRKGRKEHICANCGRWIDKGRSCLPCHDLVSRPYDKGVIDSEGYQFEWLQSYVRKLVNNGLRCHRPAATPSPEPPCPITQR